MKVIKCDKCGVHQLLSNQHTWIHVNKPEFLHLGQMDADYCPLCVQILIHKGLQYKPKENK